ncbi:MAG: septum formation protein Maf [Deltaproteobacteria bacterium]|nr:MAG: septum formation protein Maf [Deltaproteobacteria bacterium]
MNVWLASGSPRRRQLLEWSGVRVDVHPADIDESLRPDEEPVSYAARLAREKAATGPDDRTVIAADTVVHLDGEVLGKPADTAEAAAFIRRLAGRWHRVTTGVCVRHTTGEHTFAVTSEVRFRDLTEDEILAYAESGEGLDKAGAYGIQARGGSLVGEVRGSWTNVMGLPMEETLAAVEAR